MPARTACIHCGSIGLVRREHSIEGRHATLNYYCGQCNGSWFVADGAGDSEEQPARHSVSDPFLPDHDRRKGERRAADRRIAERRVAPRASAAAQLDVSRIEHENLVKQVAAHEQAIRRLDEEVRRLREQAGAPRRRSK
jgi:hypothetical protein